MPMPTETEDTAGSPAGRSTYDDTHGASSTRSTHAAAVDNARADAATDDNARADAATAIPPTRSAHAASDDNANADASPARPAGSSTYNDTHGPPCAATARSDPAADDPSATQANDGGSRLPNDRSGSLHDLKP